MAIEAGMHEAERIGELNAMMVIPQPLEDLEQTLPIASCWLEKPEQLNIPIKIKTKEKELIELTKSQDVSRTVEKDLS
jgi:carbon dioxide concentrating mechanism protein CcmO